MGDHAGSVALVTGGSSGIGRAVAELLAAGGAQVAVNSADAGEASAVGQDLRERSAVTCRKQVPGKLGARPHEGRPVRLTGAKSSFAPGEVDRHARPSRVMARG